MLFSLKTFPSLHRPSTSPFKSFPRSSSSSSSFSVKMSSSSSSSAAAAAAAAPTVEHVVLFKVRDSTDPSKIDAMISNLRSLSSLHLSTHLAAGPILRPRSSSASALAFTHLLHSRYRSQPDLSSYSSHPSHVAVVKDHVLPICDDIMALDWLAADAQFPPPPPGSAMRLTLAKPKDGVATADLIAAMEEGVRGSAAAAKAEQLSFGENFSPARAKGYTVGFISVFKGVEELDGAMESGDSSVEGVKEKVRPLVEDVIVLDFVVPSSPSPASL